MDIFKNVLFYFFKNRIRNKTKGYIMNEDIFLIFGYLGSANACLMMIPQIYLTIKKRTMEDISMQTICLNLLTQCLFLPYTIHNELYPFLTVNVFLGSFDIVLIFIYLTIYIKKTDLHESLLDENIV
tara:strand:- start:14931 stop:15311 length:381 start_codon:yes stop_codon:yes gene_type:complete